MDHGDYGEHRDHRGYRDYRDHRDFTGSYDMDDDMMGMRMGMGIHHRGYRGR
jgi:hypothetical protein